jgi:hypothetical protein
VGRAAPAQHLEAGIRLLKGHKPMTTLNQILAAFTDAYGETLQAGYECGDVNWIDPPLRVGSEA